MDFRTLDFLLDYNIPFDEHSGVNTDEYYSLSCPFCGKDKLLGFSRSSFYSTCWSCGYHNGYETVKALTGLNFIKDIIEKYGNDTSFNSIRYHREEKEKEKPRPITIEVPGKKDWHDKLKAWDYLKNERHFNPAEIISKYDLRYNTYGAGLHSYRITFPFYLGGKIVSYQSRTYTNDEIRFIACEREKEIVQHQHILYGLDSCTGRNILLVEGLFDKIRVGDNCAAVCGISTTIEQANLIRSRYDNVFLLFDQGEDAAVDSAEKFAYQISTGKCNCEIISVSDEKVDPDKYYLEHPEELLYLKKELHLY